MPTMTVPVTRRTLTPFDDPEDIAAWVAREAYRLDPSLPSKTTKAAILVARALIDNALRHGKPPVTVEVAASTVLMIEVADRGPGMPVVRADGTGSLATIVDRLSGLWNVFEREDGSKAVTAAIPIVRNPKSQSVRRTRFAGGAA